MVVIVIAIVIIMMSKFCGGLSWDPVSENLFSPEYLCSPMPATACSGMSTLSECPQLLVLEDLVEFYCPIPNLSLNYPTESRSSKFELQIRG